MSDSTYIGGRAGGATSRESGAQEASPGCNGRSEHAGEDAFAGDVVSLLSRLVRRDIVPNLITANRVIGVEALDASPASRPSAEPSAWHDGGFNAERGERDLQFSASHIRMVDVARFVRLLRGAGSDAAPALIEVLMARGIPRTELYLELLGPAARMIGDMWLDDECSFADVTMVVGRLHNILNSLRGEHADAGVEVAARSVAPTILLSAAPGDQHSFGIAVVDAVFQDAGWKTCLSYTNDAEDLLDLVKERPFDAVGLSLSNDALADVLRATIMQMRGVSRQRDLLVLVGGHAFQAPALWTYVGADALVGKGVEAALKAKGLLPRSEARMPC
jgi:methanogenic corrinoid protein MtbC1